MRNKAINLICWNMLLCRYMFLDDCCEIIKLFTTLENVMHYSLNAFQADVDVIMSEAR